MFRLITCSLFILFALEGYAQLQEQTDSLLNELSTVKEDTSQINILLQLSRLYRSSDPGKSIDYARKALTSSKQVQYKIGECNSLFAVGFAYYLQSHYTAALKEYEAALSIAQQHDLKESALNISLNIGIIHDIRGNNEEAREIYEHVYEQSSASGNKRLAAGALQNMAILRIKKGEYAQALKVFLDILPLFEALDAQTDKAKTLQNIGNLYSMCHEFDSANFYLNQSLALWEQLDDKSAIARTLFNIGSYYNDLGYNSKAKQYYDRALSMHRSLGNQRGLALCLTNMGSIFSDDGDYDKAIDYFNEANHFFTNLGLIEQSVPCLTNLGLALRKSGQTDAALQSFSQALKLQEQTGSALNKAHILYHIGVVHQEKGDAQLATRYLNRAYDIFMQLEDQREVAKTLFALGKVYENQDADTRALHYYDEATAAYLAVYPTGRYFKLAQVFHQMSRYYLNSGNLEEAGIYNWKAFAALLPENCNVPENCWHQAINGIELLNALITKVAILNAKHLRNPEETSILLSSCNTYEVGLKLIDSLRNNFRLESRRVFMEKAADLFEYDLNNLYSLYHATSEERWLHQAFTVMERYRNHWLSEMLHRREEVRYAGAPDSLVEKERMLRAEIDLYQETLLNERADTLSSSPDQEEIALLTRKLFEKNNARDALLTILKNEYPSYYQLAHQNPVTSVSEIQHNMLRYNQALMEYFVGKDAIYLVTIDERQSRFTKIDYNDYLQNALVSFSKKLTSPKANSNASDFQKQMKTAYTLYQKLMAPALEGNNFEDIIIIPDGILGFLPFETLIKQSPEPGQGFRDLAYLIKDYDISYHYSASLLAFEQPHKSKPANTFIGFAPSFKDNTADQLMAFNETVRSYMDSAQSLPYAEEEVSLVASLFAGKANLGPQATENNFKEQAANYRIIHLASHSLIDDQNPLYSKLIFDSEHDSIEDGLLHTYELYNMQLNADLVCLSACNTGVGKYYKGEGIVSLARGFMYAGVPNVMMSLWPATDRPTRDIMEYFYKELDKGVPYAKALRAAKLHYLKNADDITANPYYWGTFIYLGDTSENARFQNRNPFLLTGIIMLIVLLAAGGYFYVRNRS